MSDQMMNVRFSIKEAFELIPKLSKRILEESPKAAEISKEMAGTNFSFVADIDGTEYGFTVKDGKEVELSETPVEKPMIKVKSTVADLENFISLRGLRAMIGNGGGTAIDSNTINKSKYNTLASVNGAIAFELKNDDDSTSKIQVLFNGEESPLTKVKMKTADLTALMTKKQNPINLFMSGGMALEGDLSLPMKLQPLVI